MSPSKLSITDAALRLRRSYNVVQRLALIGELGAVQTEEGKRYVTADGVAAYLGRSSPRP